MNRTTMFLAVPALALIGLAAGCSHEQKVGMGDLPPAVKATLDREAAGGTITEVEKETKNGKLVYSADIEVNGTAWDVVVGADGTLISKEKE